MEMRRIRVGLAIGVNYHGALQIPIGSVTLSLSGMAVGALVGIILNAVLPGKDYEFGADLKGDTSVSFGPRGNSRNINGK